MHIALTAPAGNIGRPLVGRLLDAGADLTLLARHPAKLADAAARGARVEAGSLEDEAFVLRATRGVDALFWLTPPNYAAPDLREYQNALGRIAARAITENGIPRVVHLSSIGAQLGRGTGPVNGLHDIEQLFDATATRVTHLRPAAFFQNFLWQVPSIRGMGAIFMPVAGSARTPMVDTRDIAEVAAECLLAPAPGGRETRGIHGPADLSYDEAAATISAESGRSVRHVEVSSEQAREALLGTGMSASAVDAMLELYQAINEGTLVAEEARSQATTTPTSFSQFVRDILGPALG